MGSHPANLVLLNSWDSKSILKMIFNFNIQGYSSPAEGVNPAPFQVPRIGIARRVFASELQLGTLPAARG
jgi:hypothetical protein